MGTRVVNQLLTEMDGVEGTRAAGVFVMAATNRPDIIDPAMTRPGRLDKRLLVPLPSASERVEILNTLSKRTPWAPSVDLSQIAIDTRCDGFSGADLGALVREAALFAVREAIDSQGENLVVGPAHVEEAFKRISPSVSKTELFRYMSRSRA